MHQQAKIALAAPVFNPETQITRRFFWWPERLISAGLTCNIGMESIRYAGGRPLWQLSQSHHEADGKPVPVLRWSQTKWRKAEAMRGKIMRGVGTSEEWVIEEMTQEIGMRAVSVHYRRPLSIMEVAQMGRTQEVIERPGRA